MIVLKFGNESGDYVALNGIQSVRLTLRNKNSEIRSALSGGWKNSLNGAGDKNVAVRVTGIAEHSAAESVLLEGSFENRALNCTLLLGSNIWRTKVTMTCFVELYEWHYEVGNLGTFNVALISSGLVHYYQNAKDD
ncbi:hypothetical protein AM579 [Anaplasma marginale str. St. Maries]|uniref:phage tail tube protein n=1 Tax=Anaplasma marginale TaxID=770 RepID=UPI0000497BC3|nr:phage tail tube protein [Anaplasma marginale]AAV86588.1 hypothetical protein AM579 [Anaplasma marginale str. St. Maries]